MAIKALHSQRNEETARNDEQARNLQAAERRYQELNQAKNAEIQNLHAQIAAAQTSAQTASSSHDPQTAVVMQTLVKDNSELRMQMQALFEHLKVISAGKATGEGAPVEDTPTATIPVMTLPTSTMTTTPTLTLSGSGSKKDPPDQKPEPPSG